MKRSVGRGCLALAWLAAALGLAGCSSKPPPKVEPPVEVYLRRIVQAYDIADTEIDRHIHPHSNRPPPPSEGWF